MIEPHAGDCLVYAPKGIEGWIVSLRTWHMIGHVEIYAGNGRSVAARLEGVNEYPFTADGLKGIYRPAIYFNVPKAYEWFRQVRGQPYDLFGLLRFYWREKVIPDDLDRAQFCSEFCTRFYRAGEFDPFAGEEADSIAPFAFTMSPLLLRVLPGESHVV